MKTYFYKTIIESAEEGGFTAYVPKLSGCVSDGETYEETMSNIREALALYLETAKERNQEILEDDTHIAEMAVTI
jgi:predicted RNase H-like HicB family nuclease